MLFEIDDSILKKTTKCPSKFQCLRDGCCQGCEVEELVGGEHAFVKMKECKACSYAAPFGHSTICNCPTRCEIYRKYGK